jgi:hypothetical protein
MTRRDFINSAAVFGAYGWLGRPAWASAVPARKQRNYLDVTWWDPYVENITDSDTYLRRKFRQDVTDKAMGLTATRRIGKCE